MVLFCFAFVLRDKVIDLFFEILPSSNLSFIINVTVNGLNK